MDITSPNIRPTPTPRLILRAGVLWVGACLVLTMLIGCASRQPLASDPAAPPPDFAMALSFPPAHYVLEPDGTLRAATGPGVAPGLMPPPTARLTPGQTAQLWTLTRDAGLVSHASTAAKIAENTGDTAPATLTATVTAHGRQHRTRLSPPLSPQATALLRCLARLRGD